MMESNGINKAKCDRVEDNEAISAEIEKLINKSKYDSQRLLERENELSALRAQVQFYMSENSDLKKALYNRKQELIESGKEKKKMKIDYENILQELNNMKIENESLINANEENEKNLNLLDAKNNELQNDVNDLSAMNKKLQIGRAHV